MAQTHNCLGLMVYSCVTYLLFLHLNECPLRVHAAELPANKPQHCSDGGLREQYAVGTQSGAESSTATGTSRSLTPMSEAPQGASEDAEAGEASAVQSPSATSTPVWCRGPVYTIEQLSQTTLSLPLPSMSELIQPQCADWLTLADARGRQRALQLARAFSKSAAASLPTFDSPAGLMQSFIPPRKAFDLEMLDTRGSQHWRHATFRRGHIVAHGGYGIVMLVQHLTSSDESSVLGAASTDAKGPSTRGDVAHRRERGHPVPVQGDTTDGRNSQENCQMTSSTSNDAALHSDAADAGNPVLKTTQHETEEASSSTRTPSTSAALRGSGGGDPGMAFAAHLCRRLAHGKPSCSIFAAKVAICEYRDFPMGTIDREKMAEKMVRERLASFRRLWRQMPEGYSADDLYKFGFVVPLAAARISNEPRNLLGFPWIKTHILNHVQLLHPQVSDIFEFSLLDTTATLYLVKRLIQLGAHLQAAGLVHLDLKRENIAVSPAGDLTLLDFDHVMREGSIFLCREKPTPYIAAPENCRQSPYFRGVVDDRKCVATASLDRWNIGLTLFELVCSSSRYFKCYHPQTSYAKKIQCLASLQPPPPVKGEDDFSPTRAPVLWGDCHPSKQLKQLIYGFLDLSPEKRLDPLKVFVYSDLFRSLD